MSGRGPSLLMASGVAELAAGALSGWVYTLARTQPERARKLGIVSAPRVRQWHLDLAPRIGARSSQDPAEGAAGCNTSASRVPAQHVSTLERR